VIPIAALVAIAATEFMCITAWAAYRAGFRAEASKGLQRSRWQQQLPIPPRGLTRSRADQLTEG
jgi:hypothetical protein